MHEAFEKIWNEVVLNGMFAANILMKGRNLMDININKKLYGYK